MNTVLLQDILKKFSLKKIGNFSPKSQEFSGISADSRTVKPGFLFVGIPGNATHGESFLDEAIEKGAVGFLSDAQACMRGASKYPDLVFLSPCLSGAFAVRQLLAELSAFFYPERPEFIAAVTGTNGKSSIVHFALQLWGKLGQRSASIGTLGLKTMHTVDTADNPLCLLPHLTTPDAVSLHTCLHHLKSQKNVNYTAMEAGSHGLDQGRCDGLKFQCGVFSNFSQDHLDYHQNLEAYFQAKCRLFHCLLEKEAKICIHSSLKEKFLKHFPQSNPWFYGKNGDHLQLISSNPSPKGQRVVFRVFDHEFEIFLPFVGAFQAENLLAAIGIVLASGVTLDKIIPVVPCVTGIPGRLEWVGTTEKKAEIYVDYAHTPEALETVLKTLRPYTRGKLWVLFGCGGNRDAEKRPLMGKIAAQHADQVIITDDNPRFEDPSCIRNQILEQCPHAHNQPDRQKAIHRGLQLLEAHDVLLIAGKGHETGQIIGNEIFSFHDKTVAQKFLEEGKNNNEHSNNSVAKK